jgi:hypothetical protein
MVDQGKLIRAIRPVTASRKNSYEAMFDGADREGKVFS